MSLVSTWVRAQDGNYYKNPVLRGRRDGAAWFLCFDDEDPPELVLECGPGDDPRPRARDILDGLGIRYRIRGRGFLCSGRDFEGEFRQAAAIFVELQEPIPIPHEWDISGLSKDFPAGECVVYDFGGGL